MLARRILPIICGCLLAAQFGWAQPAVAAVLNGASFEPAVAPGSLVAVYGKGLANASASSPGLPLGTSLSGTTVQVNGIAAGLYYVSDTQVNAVIPPETPLGGSVPVVVTSGGVSSQPFRIRVEQCAPAVFTRAGNGTGRATVFSASYELLDQVVPGQAMSFYATGLGATATGQDGYARTVVTPSLFIGESAAMVAYAGPSGFPGVYQVNAVVPASLASERFYLTCAPAAYPSNMAEIGIPAGNNATGVSGDIRALYPKTGSAITISPLLTAATFNVRFTVAPGATSFPVAAVGSGGSIVFTVDPPAKRIIGKSQVATAAERLGDFSLTPPGSGFSVIDFWNNGSPLPGNIVPATRLDPVAVTALKSVPPPNAGPDETPNFLFETPLPSSNEVVLDDSIKANSFGSFLAIPYAPWLSSRSAFFKLYVDGRLIASDQVVYSLPTPPPPVVISLKDVSLSAAAVTGGNPVSGSVSLTGPAPAGGVVVSLSSDNAAVSLPASVTVIAGQTSATFTATTRTVSARTAVVITAKAGAESKTATLAVNPPPGIVGPFGMLFVAIAPGDFMMGCSPGDTECFDNESPRHAVKITKAFEMGIYEVTQRQWQAVMGSNPSWVFDPTDPANADRPVQEVTWNNTQAFLAALNARKDGYLYRLPTEAEWEYAARAGTTDKYAGGTKEEVACIDIYNTCVVGSFKPNAWGLYDMIGNVREFCSDWFGENYYATSPSVDPQGPLTGTQKPSRGGAWGYVAVRLQRVSSRSPYTLDDKNVMYGFRCVRQRIGN